MQKQVQASPLEEAHEPQRLEGIGTDQCLLRQDCAAVLLDERIGFVDNICSRLEE